MRVLYLNPFSQEVSGPDESLRVLLSGLIPRGIEPHVVLPAPGPQVERYRSLGATVHFAPMAVLRRDISVHAALYPVKLARAVSAIRKIARAVGAELIHTNMEVLFEGGLAARSLRIPHVLHYRGNTLDQPKWAFDVLVAAWTGISDHVFCISRATASLFERRGRDKRVEVLYNPVHLEAFARAGRSPAVQADLGGGPNAPLVGTVGRIHPRKDLETFVRAAALVSRRRPDARFVIVGAAEAPIELAYEKRLRALVDELQLGRHLCFAGARRDVPAVMAALDLFVLTSRHEGFGRVVAEAMAAGRPIVVSREGALPELVEPERYGFVAQPGDPDDFAKQILRQLDNPKEAAAMGGRALDRARTFDVGAAAARVAALYLRLGRP